MRLNDLLVVSVRQVWRHRRRYLGVVLAIALGVSGFITVISSSQDLKKNFNRDLTLIGGVTVIRLFFDKHPAQQPQWFRDETIAALRHLPGVSEVSLAALGGVNYAKHGRHFYFPIFAVDEFFWKVRGFWPSKGKLFGQEEDKQRERECVLGEELAQRIFGTTKVEGLYLEIHRDLYRISGVLGGVTDPSLAGSAYLPLTTAQDRVPGLSPPAYLYVRCNTWNDVEEVAAAIPAAVRPHQSTDLLQIGVAWEGLKRVKNMAWWIEFFVYLAISATLILGGVGIWNVMMAAVRSRTREIGLKKAMGGEDRHILAQFLAEALCISLSSAILGVALGLLTVEIMGYLIGSPPPEGLFLLCLTLGLAFGVLLGVGAGLYPSLQASRMEVVSAMRYE